MIGTLLARIVLTDRWIGLRLPYAIVLRATAYAFALALAHLLHTRVERPATRR